MVAAKRLAKWGGLSAIVLVCACLALPITAWNYDQCGDIPEGYSRQSETELAGLGLKTIEANGLRFAYRESGSGPLVMLIHGFPGFGSFRDVAPQLASAGYYVVEYAQRGYTPTDLAATGDYSMFALGRDVLALIQAFGEEKAYIVGHDWGATAAYGAAILGPEHIERMVTIAVPHPTTSKPSPEGFQRAPHFVWFQFGFLSEWGSRRHNFAYVETLIRDIQGSWIVPADHVRDVKLQLSKPGRLRALICYYRSIRTHPEQIDYLEENKIQVPTLTINSTDNTVFGTTAYEQSARGYSGHFELVSIGDAGHFFPQEAPDKVSAEISRFFARSIPGPT